MQHWISFASHIRGFIGVVIVEASSEAEATAKAIEIAPEAFQKACSVKCYVLMEHYNDVWLNRLITKPEIHEIGESVKTKREVTTLQ